MTDWSPIGKDVTILLLIGSDLYLINQSVSSFEFELSQLSAHSTPQRLRLETIGHTDLTGPAMLVCGGGQSYASMIA